MDTQAISPETSPELQQIEALQQQTQGEVLSVFYKYNTLASKIREIVSRENFNPSELTETLIQTREKFQSALPK